MARALIERPAGAAADWTISQHWDRYCCRRAVSAFLRGLGFGALDKLARLYWYTVEFGLSVEAGALRLFGSGIVSSHGEQLRARRSEPTPDRLRSRTRDAPTLSDRRR